ncbi:MAG: TraR/DksA C4-type zinc finger protein [Actinobacteria bacterium]|nr:TraR/DksA C4-type zinc finger protein [Actinomycetota bacterium]
MARAAKKPAKPARAKPAPKTGRAVKAARKPKPAPKKTAARSVTKAAARRPAAKKGPQRPPTKKAAPKPAARKAPPQKKQAPPPKKPARAASKPAAQKPAPQKKQVAVAKRSTADTKPAPHVETAPPKAPPPKPAPPVPAAKQPPKKPAKPELTPREIAAIKTSLEKQREEFSREAEEIEEGVFNISQSEMSGEVSFDEEYADAGSATFEREKEMSIGNNVRDLLDKVNHALAAIERGTYGLCENCGKPIARARLQALPYSTLCLTCKQQEERTR